MEKKLYYRAIPKANGDFYIIKEMLRGRGKNCFLTEEESINHFIEAKRMALEKYKKITVGINKLKEELGDFSFDCDVEVLDDSGLEVTMYIELDVEGYAFRFNQ